MVTTDKSKAEMDRALDLDHAERTRLPEAKGGFIPTVVHVGADLATQAAEAGFSLLRECHGELFSRTTAAIDFVDETQQGTMRVLRRMVNRVDRLTLSLVGGGEIVTSSALKAGRDAGDGVSALLSKTSAAMTEPSPGRAAA